MSTELLDLDTVAGILALNDDTDQEFARKLFTVFDRQTRELGDRIEAALVKGDLAELKYVSHRLKGSAANIGAAELAKKAGQIEKMVSSDQQSGDLSRAVEELLSLKNHSLKELSSRLLC